MNNNLVSLNLNSTKNSALQKNSTVSSNIVNLNLLNKNHIQGVKSDFQADFNELNLTEKEYTFEELMEYADKQLENMKTTAKVETVINNIGDIDPNDIDDIQRALSMYNSLTDEQKRSMSSEVKTKLENAIKDYNESVNKASEVIDAINNIGEIDFNSKDKIDEVLNLYNSLTDEQKSFLSPEVVEMINSLEQVSKQIEDTQSKINELENLYSEREDNNGFWHPIKESEIEERIKELEKELGVPHQPDEWEKILNDPGAALATFGVSVLEGFVDLGEGLVDGVVYSIAKPLQVFGVDDKWAEDIISYDVSGNMYDSFVDASGIDPEIAYGMMHSAGNFVGEMAGYYALSAIPYAGPALCAVAGAGSAVEDSINRQLEDSGTVNDWVVFGESALGALEGFGFGQAGKAAHQGINALKELGASGTKELIKSQAKNLSKETIKQTIKEQGKNIVKKTAIDTLKDADTWMETGAVVIDNVVTGMETGEWNFGRMAGETAVVLGGNFVGNLGGNYLNLANETRIAKSPVDVQLSSTGNIESVAPSKLTLNSAPSIQGTNSVNNYVFDRELYINHVNELFAQGYSDRMVIEQLASYGNRCSEIVNKRALADFSYEALLAWGYDQKSAANLLQDIYQTQLDNRGMSCVMTIDGIRYNTINDFNYANQAYTIEHIREQIRVMPPEIRKTITEVNLYDTFNPSDYYWNNEYKSNGSYFRSAATGGYGQINIWANDYTDPSTIFHESGHCFDEVIGYNHDGSAIRLHSDSQEYLQAIYADAQLTGKQSITDYGGNNPAEDFAETMAAYHGGFSNIDINQFPNRKAYIEKHIKVTGQQYLSVHNCNMLNVVSNTISQKYGADQVTNYLYHYLTTGNLTYITSTNGARNIVASMDRNEVIEYYNLLVGGI